MGKAALRQQQRRRAAKATRRISLALVKGSMLCHRTLRTNSHTNQWR